MRPPSFELSLNDLGPLYEAGARRVLVVGDVMLDRYFVGDGTKLCREAPVPALEVDTVRAQPGGAANAAHNLAALGAEVTLVGAIGPDEDGEALRSLLQERAVSTRALVAAERRATLSKNRLIAGSQLLMRFDRGSTEPLDAATQQVLLAELRDLFTAHEAVLVSDYGYGLLTDELIAALGQLQARAPRLLVVDARDPLRYASVGMTAAKPNFDESRRLLGEPTAATTGDRLDLLVRNADALLERLKAQIVAVTVDADGALILQAGKPPYRVAARPGTGLNATGGGDTFVAAFTLALAGGAAPETAGEIAAAAGSVVVHKPFTATCGLDELLAFAASREKRLNHVQEVRALGRHHRSCGDSIVFTNGCFDILHSGHIELLKRAAALGDKLVVGVNSDASVARLKGADRPINSLEDRIAVLAALGIVDHIVVFEEDTAADVIRALHPDVFVKGGDYSIETIPEAPLVRQLGGRIEILPYVRDRSTSELVQKIRRTPAQPSGATTS